jgi:tight adherence protein C
VNAHSVQLFGAIAAAIFAAIVAHHLTPSPARLAGRLRPYTAVSRSALGRAPDATSVVLSSTDRSGGSSLERLVRPFAEALARGLTGFLGQRNQNELALRLRQAGIDVDLDDAQRVHNYRVRQLSKAVVYGSFGVAMSLINGFSPAPSFLFVVVGAVLGSTREPARIGRLLQTRIDRMRIELYTINQQLAMHLRTGGSSIQAVQRICRRGHGEVIAEMREALRQHERGLTAANAFLRIAENTPEPFAARTYRLLASGAERGADLAEGLLALSDDVREIRRESLRRSATRRRAQMLLPTIGLMAPILILFIAAPLPVILFGVKH